MSNVDLVGLIIGIAGLIVGMVGTGLALYQRGVLNAEKKRRHELQYLLAGVSNTSLLKSQAWVNQLNSYPAPQNAADIELLRSLLRARDDFTEIHSLVAALEGAVDSEESATTNILRRTLEQGRINNEIQQTALENPARARSIQEDQGGDDAH
jgi:hypothetical protein